jgi:hypothetical protein
MMVAEDVIITEEVLVVEEVQPGREGNFALEGSVVDSDLTETLKKAVWR